MSVVLYVDFPHQGSFGEEMASQLSELAKSIIQEPGCIWKIWTENQTEQEAGGIYLFEDRDSAKKYLEKHSKRLTEWGYTNIKGKIFEINETLTKFGNAPV